MRVEVARLRSRLRRYYEGAGKQDPVWISLPAGTYSPVVRPRGEHPERSEDRVIAVLPFLDLTDHEHGGSFAEELTEELIAALSQIAGLRVVCHTSVCRFERESYDIGKAARELNAVALAEGVVRNLGPRVRVAVRLIDIMSGCIVWSGTFTRQVGDLIATEARISRAIVKAMMPHLPASSVDPSRSPAGPTKPA